MVVQLLASAPQWQHVVIYAPALVVGLGLISAVMILLGRAFAASVREANNPRWIYAGLVGLVGVVIILTWLGVSLPRE
jgi:hypothetical protein